MVPTILLSYQLSVVLRCIKLIKKGGQHYIVPDLEVIQAPVVRETLSISVGTLDG